MNHVGDICTRKCPLALMCAIVIVGAVGVFGTVEVSAGRSPRTRSDDGLTAASQNAATKYLAPRADLAQLRATAGLAAWSTEPATGTIGAPSVKIPGATAATATTPGMPINAPGMAVGTCPVDSTPIDVGIPLAEPGVLQSSSYGENGPLGGHIFGAGVANPYYEIGMPTDGVHATAPVGVMLEIHGGGWVAVGPGRVGSMRLEADFWRAHGWETVNLDYRGCRQSVDDVLAVYARVRQVVGAHTVICASGESAGGSLALVLAAKAGGGISCVISDAGITDFSSLSTGSSYPSGTPGVSASGLAADILVVFNATNADQLGPFSPITYAPSFTTPALLATAVNDVVIPLSQAVSFHDSVLRSHPGDYIDVYELPCPALANLVLVCGETALRPTIDGAPTFVHGRTSPAGLNMFRRKELQLARFALAAGH